MRREPQGRYVAISTVGESVKAFVPHPLPPNPPIDWTPGLREKFDQALLELGRLDSASSLLPETSLFLCMYVRKEAVLSSMIEGTQSSLSDLLLFELEEEPGRKLALECLNDGIAMLAALYRSAYESARPTAGQIEKWVRINRFDPELIPGMMPAEETGSGKSRLPSDPKNP